VPRYRLSIAYDGTDFCGWQRQHLPADIARAHGHDVTGEASEGRVELRSVQNVVQSAIQEVVREPVNLIGASRTDAGVHARAQTAAFTTTGAQGGPPEERMGEAISSRLPDDVLVRSAASVADDFDPITDCIAKGYSYTFHVGRARPLWDRRYVHHVRESLDAEAMSAAGAVLVGRHEFAAFAAAGHGRESTVRTVLHCAVRAHRSEHDEPRITVTVAADGFLWNMVRIIAGTVMDVGRGRLTPDDVRAAIASGDRRNAGPTVPPTGLCLEWGAYSEKELAYHTEQLHVASELLDCARATAAGRKRRMAEFRAARATPDSDPGVDA
jgi:tRNA pseudouridine38-40 synthase